MNKREILALTACCFLITINGLAQENRAVLTGIATDTSQARLAGATVQIDNLATGFHRVVKTGESGSYYAGGIPIGVHDVTFNKENFRAQRFEAVELVVGQTRTLTRP